MTGPDSNPMVCFFYLKKNIWHELLYVFSSFIVKNVLAMNGCANQGLLVKTIGCAKESRWFQSITAPYMTRILDINLHSVLSG
jgi:hypothetical protein